MKGNPEKFNEWLWSIALAKDNQTIENKLYAAEKLAKIYSRYKKEIFREKQQMAQEEAGKAERLAQKYDKLAKLQEGVKTVLKGALAFSPLGLTGCGRVPIIFPPDPKIPTNLENNVDLKINGSHIEGPTPNGRVSMDTGTEGAYFTVKGSTPSGSIDLNCNYEQKEIKYIYGANIGGFNINVGEGTAAKFNLINIVGSTPNDTVDLKIYCFSGDRYYVEGKMRGEKIKLMKGSYSGDDYVEIKGEVPGGYVNLGANPTNILGHVPNGDYVSMTLPAIIKNFYPKFSW